MNIFKKLFSTKKNFNASTLDEKCRGLVELRHFIDEIEISDHYVPGSEYRTQIFSYEKVIQHFKVLSDSGMLSQYCKGNSEITVNYVIETISKYENIIELVDKHNEAFIAKSLKDEKKYFDSILKEVDPAITLDEDQRKVILTDEDYCLVIAGAGAGKTTTMAAKVKYLVEKKHIDPKQILVVSFTNKAVEELKEKIKIGLGIDCPITTFHSTGNAIIHKNSPDEKLHIVEGSKLYFTIRDYFRGSIMQNENVVNKLIMFFASYFDAPYEGDDLNVFFNQIAKGNYSTMRSDLSEFKREIIDSRTKKSVTIQNEVLRSHQEVEIANFLFLNNIDYEYEPIYQYDIQYSRKPYTPDFIIKQGEKVAYIEHFGITENGENDRFSDDEVTAYKRAVNDKIMLHRKHGTTLIYTFSKYNDKRPIVEHLRQQLEDNGFEIKPRSSDEVMEMLIAGEENRYVRKLINLICRFISNFKVNGYTADEFNRMYHSTQNVRSRLFLEICNDCYLEYERYLKENNAVDFQDMINESTRLLREVKEMKQKLDFKYIIVDEYQDISRQRFDLTKALSEVTDAKIIAVGDDWQSIYAFSGSDITLFTKFAEKMGYAKLLKITKTYRNAQQVIDIAGNFIQKNKAQIQKTLESPKNIDDPVIIYTYDGKYKGPDGNRRSGAMYAIAHAIETALDQIVEFNKKSGKKQGNVLLLGRYGFDGDHLEKTGLFEYISKDYKVRSIKHPKIDITFMTVHSSKGLGYDDVIIVNGKNETYGFPSKIEDDPVLSFVIKGDRSIDYAEERRLFYVAMTRTKNRVYCIAPENNPSEFLLELKHDFKNIRLEGKWNEEEPIQLGKRACPLCGYPMQYKYKNAYGLRLYICTNEPELCGFMTNEYKAGKLSIMKCDKCRDGYLIVKPGRDHGYFLGCSNYKKDGKGCNNSIGIAQYYEMFGYQQEEIAQMDEKREKSQSYKNSLKDESIAERGAEILATIEKAEIMTIEYKGHDLNTVLCDILNSIQEISDERFYGMSMITDILRGAHSERITKMKLNELKCYGLLSTFSREDVTAIIEWMIVMKLLLKTKSQYPVIHITTTGYDYKNNITEKELKVLKKKLEEDVITWIQ